MSNSIKSVRWLGEYRIKLVFKDGFVGQLDLRPVADSPRGQMDAPLKEIEFFGRVDCDGFTIAWPNGYDICPDVLRYWCKAGRVCSKEETDAFFLRRIEESSSAVVLNDKPKS